MEGDRLTGPSTQFAPSATGHRSLGDPARVPVQAGASLAGKLSSEASSTLSNEGAASGDGPGAAACRGSARPDVTSDDAVSRSGM